MRNDSPVKRVEVGSTRSVACRKEVLRKNKERSAQRRERERGEGRNGFEAHLHPNGTIGSVRRRRSSQPVSFRSKRFEILNHAKVTAVSSNAREEELGLASTTNPDPESSALLRGHESLKTNHDQICVS